MALCKDPVTKELNSRGYNLVKLPRAGIEPMDVLGRDGRVHGEARLDLGSLDVNSGRVPAIGAPTPAAGITGEKSNDLDLGVGLKLLSNVLAGLGGRHQPAVAQRGLQACEESAVPLHERRVRQYHALRAWQVPRHGHARHDQPVRGALFPATTRRREYIIFDVLKSDALSVTAKSDSGADVAVDVGALSGALNANVKAQGRQRLGQRDHLPGQREGDVRLQAVRSILRERQVGAARRRRRRGSLVRARGWRCRRIRQKRGYRSGLDESGSNSRAMGMDGTLRLMNAQGFNLVERHEIPIAPLDVLGRDDVLERIGTLASLLLAPGVALGDPFVQPAPSFSGLQTDAVHVSDGFEGTRTIRSGVVGRFHDGSSRASPLRPRRAILPVCLSGRHDRIGRVAGPGEVSGPRAAASRPARRSVSRQPGRGRVRGSPTCCSRRC